MKHYAMVIDLRKCIGCKGCIAICSMTWNTPVNRELNDPELIRKEIMAWLEGDTNQLNSALVEITQNGNLLSRFEPCMHCDEPACAKACKVRAIKKKEDGIVVVDYNRCVGLHLCVRACPYEKLYIRKFATPNVPAGKVDKCTFCAALVDKGELPMCMKTCQGRAIYFGDLMDEQSQISQILRKEINRAHILEKKGGRLLKIFERKNTLTKPNVYYLL